MKKQFESDVDYAIQRILNEQQRHFDVFNIFIVIDAEEDPENHNESDQYLQLQYSVENAIRRTGVLSNIRKTPIDQRKVHIHFVFNSPKLTSYNSLDSIDRIASETFVSRLKIIEHMAQWNGPGALSRIWVTSRYTPGAQVSLDESAANCCALIRLVCKQGLQNQWSNQNDRDFVPFASSINSEFCEPGIVNEYP